MIDGDQLKRLLMQKPVILMKIMEQFTKRMRTLEQRLSDISYKEVDARVANYLLKNTTKNQPSFLLNVSKKDLASMLGTTRESISRKLSEFQKMHYIAMDGQTIEIHNFDALKKIAMK
jgi:CRP/FNR family transcriptional regulator, anaerobic regulatory protein